MYDERAVYGLTRVIKNSPDPVAKTIALNEMLDLLELQRRQGASEKPAVAGSVL